MEPKTSHIQSTHSTTELCSQPLAAIQVSCCQPFQPTEQGNECVHTNPFTCSMCKSLCEPEHAFILMSPKMSYWQVDHSSSLHSIREKPGSTIIHAFTYLFSSSTRFYQYQNRPPTPLWETRFSSKVQLALCMLFDSHTFGCWYNLSVSVSLCVRVYK
jgi:hypothetical protein